MNAAIKVEKLSKQYQIGKQIKKNLNFQEHLTELVAGHLGGRIVINGQVGVAKMNSVMIKNIQFDD